MNKSFNMGAEISVFLVDENKNPVLSTGLLQRKDGGKEGGEFREDGYQIRVILNPTDNINIFRVSVKHILASLKSELSKMNLDFVFCPSMLSSSIPVEARSIKNIYKKNIYSAGGEEIYNHVGKYKPEVIITIDDGQFAIKNNPEFLGTLIPNLDIHVGMPLFVSDTSEVRRKMHNKMGMFSITPVGVNYYCSNVWIQYNSLIEWIYKQVSMMYHVTYTTKSANIFDVITRTDYLKILNATKNDKVTEVKNALKYYWNLCPPLALTID